jgi:hypothetical protein
LISAHRGSQALGPTLHVPSPSSLTSPLPLGSVRTEIASAELAPRCCFRAVWRRVPSLRKRNDILRAQPDACYGVSLPDPAANAPTWSHSHTEMHRTPRPCRAYHEPVTAKDICLRRVTEKRPALQPTGRKNSSNDVWLRPPPASGMEARRGKPREAGFPQSQRPGPEGRRPSCWPAVDTTFK